MAGFINVKAAGTYSYHLPFKYTGYSQLQVCVLHACSSLTLEYNIPRGCEAVKSGGSSSTFQRYVLPPSSGWNNKASRQPEASGK
jgi:hypothetical protein